MLSYSDAFKCLNNMAINLCGLAASNPNCFPDYKAMDMAIEALKEKEARENPAPLSLSELKSKIGEPVYVVSPDNTLAKPLRGWCVFIDVDDECIREKAYGWVGMARYGERWIAYAGKPKEVNK